MILKNRLPTSPVIRFLKTQQKSNKLNQRFLQFDAINYQKYCDTTVPQKLDLSKLDQLSVKELQTELRKRGSKISGKKIELKERIINLRLLEEVENGSLKNVKFFIEEGGANVDSQESKIQTPLTIAVSYGHRDIGNQILGEQRC